MSQVLTERPSASSGTLKVPPINGAGIPEKNRTLMKHSNSEKKFNKTRKTSYAEASLNDILSSSYDGPVN